MDEESNKFSKIFKEADSSYFYSRNFYDFFHIVLLLYELFQDQNIFYHPDFLGIVSKVNNFYYGNF